MKLLIVDTDPGRLRAFDVLKTQGHLVLSADSWSEAREGLARLPFQILVLGPGEDIEQVAEWRGSQSSNKVPLIAAMGERSATGGVDHPLPLPLNEEQIAALPGLPGVPTAEEVIDRAAALEICDNDEELLREIGDIFINSGPERIGKLSKAVTEGDRDKVLDAAHLIKGSALNLAAHPLRVAVRQLENTLETEGWSSVPFWLEVVLYEYRRLAGFLESLGKPGKEAS